MGSTEQHPLHVLLPRYAEYGLRTWLEAILQVIPPGPDFVTRLLSETARISNATTVGLTLGKILDLLARGAVSPGLIEQFSLPWSLQEPGPACDFLSALRSHTNKIFSNTELAEHPGSKRVTAVSVEQREASYRVWSALEPLATTNLSELHLSGILMLWWRAPVFTPVDSHAHGFGGFYRHPAAAMVLRTDYVGPLHHALLSTRRDDMRPDWYTERPYAPSLDVTLRRDCFALLCPDLVPAFDMWCEVASTNSFPEVCRLLRYASRNDVALTLPEALSGDE